MRTVLLVLLSLVSNAWAVPAVEEMPNAVRITGAAYRLTFARYSSEVGFELRDWKGAWRQVSKKNGTAEFALSEAGTLRSSAGNPARFRHEIRDGYVAAGLTTALAVEPPRIAMMHFLCADAGVLVSFEVTGPRLPDGCTLWAMPRWPLETSLFERYSFFGDGDVLHTGHLAGLGDRQAYAGVSAWGSKGDTVPRFSNKHPALILHSTAAGTGFGVVFVRYGSDWERSHSFFQRYTPEDCYLYAAMAPLKPPKSRRWAWLAPFPGADATSQRVQIESLIQWGEAHVDSFQPLAPEPEASWTEPVPDFPAAWRRSQPVRDIRDAVVYTVHETMDSDDGVRAGAKVGSDLWIRGWFKWHQARDYVPLGHLVTKAHALGALFGGGITCSALYDGENGLTDAQWRDLATRDPDGRLVDAWGEPGCRHGTLSNPAYREYLLSWCRNQIDAGVDYLFMDEINAALQANEGYDDYSLRDFRSYLLRKAGEGKGWKPDDARWREVYRIELADREICPDGTVNSFDYRTYLRKQGLSGSGFDGIKNPLNAFWHGFRKERDDRAWKELTDGIRSYAAGKQRKVLISGNGLARYVDLQVLGVWSNWRVRDGRIDLSAPQLDEWASTVAAGRSLAGGRVPVVFFHDWGFNGFPWMEVSPSERALWLRVRGAEIYAAGGFFAFPIHGPGNNDALRDGTVGEVARQTAFYQRNKGLYLRAHLLGFEPIESAAPLLSKALWRCEDQAALALHVVNRRIEGGHLTPRSQVELRLPVARLPRSVRIVSPDWEGERTGTARLSGGRVIVTLPELEAYAVAMLDYDEVPEVGMASVRTVPIGRWERPEQAEFIVDRGGTVREAAALPSFLHGDLHSDLREPPVFLVAMPRGGKLRVHVRSVATLGARLECLVDGAVAGSVELPDLDRKNDSGAAEYDRTVEFLIPPGRHRVTLRNVGGDWASVAWYAFEGEVAAW